MNNIFYRAAILEFDSISVLLYVFDVACKMIIDEVQYAIKKEDPKKMIEVSMCMGTTYVLSAN